MELVAQTLEAEKQRKTKDAGTIEEPASYFTTPNGAIISQMKKTANHATKNHKKQKTTKQKGFKEMLEASNTSSSEQIKVYDLGLTDTSKRVVRKKGESVTEIEITNTNALKPLSETGEHILNLVLTETSKQCLSNGMLFKDDIAIPLQDIVDKGICASVESARSSCKSFFNAISNIKISYTTTEGKGKKARTLKTSAEGASVLYYAYEIKNNVFYISASKKVNWLAITESYTIMPNYYYRLASKDAKLLDYIARQSRTHQKAIKDNGQYNISIDAIIKHLALQNAVNSKDPKGKFRKPLAEAVKAINKMDMAEAKKEAGANNEAIETCRHYQLDLCNQLGQPMTEADPNTVFTNGYIKVTLKGKELEYFTHREQHHTQKTLDRQKKAEAKEERIKALALAKSMAKEKEAETE